MTAKKKALLEINLATLLFGFIGPLAKVIPLSPLPITFWRAVCAALLLSLVGKRLGGRTRIRSRADLLIFLAIAVLISLQSLFFLRSIQVSTVAIALITLFTYPVLMVFLESWFFGGRIRLLDLGSAALVVVGVYFITPEHSFSDATFQGVVFGILAGFTIPLIILIRKKYLVGRYPSWNITAYEFSFVSLILLPFMILTGSFRAIPGPEGIAYLLILGLLVTGVGRMLVVSSLAHLSGKTVGLTIVLEILYGIVFAFAFLSEVPTHREMVGGLLVVSVVLVETLRDRKEQEPGAPS